VWVDGCGHPPQLAVLFQPGQELAEIGVRHMISIPAPPQTRASG
jgi:hypothetical protein